MASSSSSSTTTTTPLLSSPPSSNKELQQYWLNHSTQTFSNHLNTNTNLPICIFHLPETLTSQNPNSYIPQNIGLGPIHHFRTDIYTKQEQLKLTTSKTILKPYKIPPEFHKIILEKLTELVPAARCFYDLYFDIDDECLAWVFVIDALYLLDEMSKVANAHPSEYSYSEDVIKVENQIPVVILSQLITTIQQHSTDEFDDIDLNNLLVKFCKTLSPFKFAAIELDFDVGGTFHLLDCMYRLVVNHKLPPKNPFLRTNFLLDVHLEDVEHAVQMDVHLEDVEHAVQTDVHLEDVEHALQTDVHLEDVEHALQTDVHLEDVEHALQTDVHLEDFEHLVQMAVHLEDIEHPVQMAVHLEDVEHAVQMAGGLFPGLNAFLQPVLLVLKLPWDKVISWVNNKFGENQTLVEIDIPSVSKLSKIGKVEFYSTPRGIHDIKFDDVKPAFTLPVLELKPGVEAVIRNLVAYEEFMFKNDNIKNVDFGEYVELMCGIIDSVKDVKILRERNIIEGDMSDEEIVELFNGIEKSSVKKDGKKSELQKTVDKVNVYFGDLPRVKVCNVIKKVFIASWKVLLIVFSVVSLVLVVVTSVCQVYDCKGRFGLGHVRSVLDYVVRDNEVVDF